MSDAAAALRLKRQELATKRAELDALLQAKRAPLLQLLGVTQLPPPVQVGLVVPVVCLLWGFEGCRAKRAPLPRLLGCKELSSSPASVGAASCF